MGRNAKILVAVAVQGGGRCGEHDERLLAWFLADIGSPSDDVTSSDGAWPSSWAPASPSIP
jgi:hypothetical protein